MISPSVSLFCVRLFINVISIRNKHFPAHWSIVTLNKFMLKCFVPCISAEGIGDAFGAGDKNLRTRRLHDTSCNSLNFQQPAAVALTRFLTS
jgi:hypothetical protein